MSSRRGAVSIIPLAKTCYLMTTGGTVRETAGKVLGTEGDPLEPLLCNCAAWRPSLYLFYFRASVSGESTELQLSVCLVPYGRVTYVKYLDMKTLIKKTKESFTQ
jgi:hypothetical protein